MGHCQWFHANASTQQAILMIIDIIDSKNMPTIMAILCDLSLSLSLLNDNFNSIVKRGNVGTKLTGKSLIMFE